MTKYNWRYEALGFESEAEMKESIERVERRMKQGDIENEIERLKEAQSTIDTHGNINFEAMNAGARRNELDRMVQNKMNSDRQRANQQAQQEQIQSILNKAGDSMEQENKAKADAELEKAKQKADAELQKEIFEKHGIKTDKQQADDGSLSNMLKGLK